MLSYCQLKVKISQTDRDLGDKNILIEIDAKKQNKTYFAFPFDCLMFFFEKVGN